MKGPLAKENIRQRLSRMGGKGEKLRKGSAEKMTKCGASADPVFESSLVKDLPLFLESGTEIRNK
jgi:hypothetical protein